MDKWTRKNYGEGDLDMKNVDGIPGTLESRQKEKYQKYTDFAYQRCCSTGTGIWIQDGIHSNLPL